MELKIATFGKSVQWARDRVCVRLMMGIDGEWEKTITLRMTCLVA